jgi:hypothetical protein
LQKNGATQKLSEKQPSRSLIEILQDAFLPKPMRLLLGGVEYNTEIRLIVNQAHI